MNLYSATVVENAEGLKERGLFCALVPLFPAGLPERTGRRHENQTSPSILRASREGGRSGAEDLLSLVFGNNKQKTNKTNKKHENRTRKTTESSH